MRSLPDPANKMDNPEYKFFILVDSGADITYVPREVAETLNLNLDSNKMGKTNSASNEFKTFKTTIYAEIIRNGERVTIGQIPIVVPEEYMNPTDNEDVKNSILLGRHMVFEKFLIIFNEAEHKVIFRVP